MINGKVRTGADNNWWKGGRSIASNGYVLIRVGKEHHLSDVRGYAYEHRLVAERKLGRRLLRGEIPHHIDGNKQNNDPANLEVVSSIAEHRLHHRTKVREVPLRMPLEDNEVISCKCGCGIQFERFDQAGRPRFFVSGHNPQPSQSRDELLSLLSRCGPLDREMIARGLNRSVQSVGVMLSKLKKAGKVRQERRGVWRING